MLHKRDRQSLGTIGSLLITSNTRGNTEIKTNTSICQYVSPKTSKAAMQFISPFYFIGLCRRLRPINYIKHDIELYKFIYRRLTARSVLRAWTKKGLVSDRTRGEFLPDMIA